MVKNIVTIACLVMALVSCNKIEHKLDGKWQLKTVEANGATHSVDTVWYNIQTSLFQYQLYDRARDTYRTNVGFRTVKDDTKLELELITNGQPVEKFLPYTDWTSPLRTFTIEKSTVTKLILNSEGKTYTFERF